jgi:hypothetical protein
MCLSLKKATGTVMQNVAQRQLKKDRFNYKIYFHYLQAFQDFSFGYNDL